MKITIEFDDEREDRSGFHDLLHQKQQTKWDVEIEMESNLHIGEVADDSYPKGFPTQKPQLDAEGCFILKLKSE